MSETNPRQTEIPNPPGSGTTEPGFIHIAESSEQEEQEKTVKIVPPVNASQDAKTARTTERPGTVEHLAARRSFSVLDAETPEMKQRLAELRSQITRLLTAFRWEGASAEETAKQLQPLLNVGPIQQWKEVLLPFLHEIDRAGNLIPVWHKIIEQGDPPDLPADTNPAETPEGRARRYAILMLGYYRSITTEQDRTVGFARAGSKLGDAKAADLARTLSKLALDPNTSMYATQSLAKQNTTVALQALISTLKDAEGWAKVDIVEACLSIKQENFYELLVASGLDRVRGLESYIAIPIYRTIPLENYLRGQSENPRLAQQAALIFNQVLLDNMTPPQGEAVQLPVLFERSFIEPVQALFEGARSNPQWQYAIAVHRLGLLLGRYWASISNGDLKDGRIIEKVYPCFPLMAEVERWMAGPGRDIMLTTLAEGDEEEIAPTVKVLGELREPRATALLIQHIERTQQIRDHTHALRLGAIVDTLGLLGDRRAATPLSQMLHRIVDLEKRSALPKQKNNLPHGDSEIPNSIIYAAVIRANGQLNDRSALDDTLRATDDVDPYVRTQAIEALKRLDPEGEDARSRKAARTALNDPRESVVSGACQVVQQYRDTEATSLLRTLIETRPELAAVAYNTLRQMGQ